MEASSLALTVAVDAAARHFYEGRSVAFQIDGVAIVRPTFDELSKVDQHQLRQAVLPLVNSVLVALPDERWAAFAEGQAAGEHAENPYPLDPRDFS